MKKTLDQTPIVWTIAGSDSGGGAGIQADLHTFGDFSVHGCSVISAVTAQNTMAVTDSLAVNREVLQAQLDALDVDLPASAIKLGMLADQHAVTTVADYLANYSGFVVCDPVMVASSGAALISDEAITALKERLLPRVDLITPNVPEASVLTGIDIACADDVVNAAVELISMGARSVLLTGGHWHDSSERCLDYWTDGECSFWLSGEKIPQGDAHGSGCTLSSAIAAMMAKGYELADAMVVAKAYVTQGIRHAGKLGQGARAVAHLGWPERLEDLPELHHQLPTVKPEFEPCRGELGLYPVVDSVEWVAKLLPLGVPTIQLRIKNITEERAREYIRQAVTLCKSYDTCLFINDYWQLAIELGAYGVHLGQEDLDTADLHAIASAGLKLGVSTHSYYEIARAHGIRPSYIALGPVYATTTKQMKFAPLGIEQLQQWVDLLKGDYCLTAIGGISVSRCEDVAATGVGSCAMVSAITQASDYPAVVKQLICTIG